VWQCVASEVSRSSTTVLCSEVVAEAIVAEDDDVVRLTPGVAHLSVRLPQAVIDDVLSERDACCLGLSAAVQLPLVEVEGKQLCERDLWLRWGWRRGDDSEASERCGAVLLELMRHGRYSQRIVPEGAPSTISTKRPALGGSLMPSLE